MRSSRISNPTVGAATAVSLLGMLVPGLAARAADVDQPAALGQPIILFSHDAPAASPPGLLHSAGATTPTKRPAGPVQRAPLIPPTSLAVKLGPPPAPRPAMSLETDLQPLAPAPPTPTGASNPAGSKAPLS
jgi:hypothetical protein